MTKHYHSLKCRFIETTHQTWSNYLLPLCFSWSWIEIKNESPIFDLQNLYLKQIWSRYRRLPGTEILKGFKTSNICHTVPGLTVFHLMLHTILADWVKASEMFLLSQKRHIQLFGNNFTHINHVTLLKAMSSMSVKQMTNCRVPEHINQLITQLISMCHKCYSIKYKTANR